MECINCGATLKGKSDICTYCGTLNDTDLRALHYYTENAPESDRMCPRCEIPLRTLNLQLGKHFYIDRCEHCLGIFFDTGELEYLIKHTVEHVSEVDYTKINILLKERKKNDYPVTYIKCPVCEKFMNRQIYGSRSGVIVDKCKEHGVWVDGGELGTLFRWTKAGGQIHNSQRKEAKARLPKEGLKVDFKDIWSDERFKDTSNENSFVRCLRILFK